MNGIYRGIGREKEQWFSICSTHHIHDIDCKLCNSGTWVKLRDHFFEHIVYTTNPDLWKKYFVHPVVFESFS